jgi:enhancing lycopene biosynthesis protein 2
MKKFAVILAGCGVYDGAEIQEATLSLYMIKKLGADYAVFAPDIPQYHVVNHITGEEMPEKRNVLIESARIARGKISPLSRLKAADFDALLMPGGFGAAKNLCNFAFKGEYCEVNPELAAVVDDFLKADKPIGALCISPVILARLLGDVDVTIGDNRDEAEKIEKMGAHHVKATHGQVVCDTRRKVYTTPCYNLDAANIVQVAEGIENIVKAILADGK